MLNVGEIRKTTDRQHPATDYTSSRNASCRSKSVYNDMISAENDTVVDEPTPSPGQAFDESRQVSGAPPNAVSRVTARMPKWVAIMGVAGALILSSVLWLVGGVLWSTVAGEANTGPAGFWPGFALTRPGIVYIRGRIRQVELPASVSTVLTGLILVLQFVATLLLGRFLED